MSANLSHLSRLTRPVAAARLEAHRLPHRQLPSDHFPETLTLFLTRRCSTTLRTSKQELGSEHFT